MSTTALRAGMTPTVGLAVGLMAIIVMMVLPMPAWVLDVGVAVSFAFAILIFTLTLFIEKPLDFSAFPSVLLAALLLRLSLNVSSTKLIIGEGHTGPDAAGSVIEGFAMFIMGGNIAIGLIVFAVLVIVNFMVITKGAGRMAEVGARFALDAMPGKQMAIDSDLAAGAISHAEASARRAQEQEETAFLGSLDGVSKFMKGDAIAGILITLLNLVAGMAIGIGVHGVSASEAVSNYAILTVGDGLVSQIPAVIISVSAGLLLSKGRETGTVDLALVAQFGRHPAALAAVAAIMAVFAFFPGLPMLPFLSGSVGLAVWAWRASRRDDAPDEAEAEEVPISESARLADMLGMDELRITISRDLVPTVMGEAFGFDQRTRKIRQFIATEYGFILPPIRLSDDPVLPAQTYVIRLHDAEMATQMLQADKRLALIEAGEHAHIRGETTREPVFGAPARWVAPEDEAELMAVGVTTVAPTEVLATHVLEIIQDNLDGLLTRRALRDTLDALKEVTDTERARANRQMFDDVFPDKVPVALLHDVLRLLLEERVPVRNMALILETCAAGKGHGMAPEAIAELVRQKLGRQFVARFRNAQGQLPIVRLGDAWEARFRDAEVAGPDGTVRDVALSPDDFNALARDLRVHIDQAAGRGTFPVIAAPAHRRRFLRSVTSRKGIKNPVLSYAEIAGGETPLILGVA